MTISTSSIVYDHLHFLHCVEARLDVLEDDQRMAGHGAARATQRLCGAVGVLSAAIDRIGLADVRKGALACRLAGGGGAGRRGGHWVACLPKSADNYADSPKL